VRGPATGTGGIRTNEHGSAPKSAVSAWTHARSSADRHLQWRPGRKSGQPRAIGRLFLEAAHGVCADGPSIAYRKPPTGDRAHIAASDAASSRPACIQYTQRDPHPGGLHDVGHAVLREPRPPREVEFSLRFRGLDAASHAAPGACGRPFLAYPARCVHPTHAQARTANVGHYRACRLLPPMTAPSGTAPPQGPNSPTSKPPRISSRIS
jgi:hypothetical protein